MEMFFELLQNFYKYSLTAKRSNKFWRFLYKLDVLRWKAAVYISLKLKLKKLDFPTLIFQYAILIDTLLHLEYLTAEKIRSVDEDLTVVIGRKGEGYTNMNEIMVDFVRISFSDKDVEDNTESSYSVEIKHEQDRFFCTIKFAEIPLVYDGRKWYSKQLNYRSLTQDDFMDSDSLMQINLEKYIRAKLFKDIKHTLYKSVECI